MVITFGVIQAPHLYAFHALPALYARYEEAIIIYNTLLHEHVQEWGVRKQSLMNKQKTFSSISKQKYAKLCLENGHV